MAREANGFLLNEQMNEPTGGRAPQRDVCAMKPADTAASGTAGPESERCKAPSPAARVLVT